MMGDDACVRVCGKKKETESALSPSCSLSLSLEGLERGRAVYTIHRIDAKEYENEC